MNESEIRNACSSLFLTLPDGGRMPRLGQGSWHTAERAGRRAGELATLRRLSHAAA